MELFPFSVQGLSRGVRVRQRVRAAPAAGQRPRQDARGARGQSGDHQRRRRGRRHQRRRRLCRRRRHDQGRKECDAMVDFIYSLTTFKKRIQQNLCVS